MGCVAICIPNPNTSHIIASCRTGEPPNVGYSTSFGGPPVAMLRPDRTVTLPNNNIHLSAGSSSCKVANVPTPPLPSMAETMGGRRRCNGLGTMWREIHGSNNWDGLVEPLNPLLREEIVRYGELIAACYKAFNLNPSSNRYLSCKYGRRNMLEEAGVVNSGYEVTRYVYAAPSFSKVPLDDDGARTRTRTAAATTSSPSSSSSSCSRWLGYVAVSSDEAVKRLGRRDVAIVFRGTVTNPEWIANFMSSLTPARLDPLDDRADVKVESGFLNLYTSEDKNSKFGIRSCREQLLSEVSRIINKYKGEDMSITIAGHSMGSSIALLLAYDIAELGLNRIFSSKREVPIAVYSFGGPRVGNYGFKDRCEELGIRVLRIANVNDPITKLPGIVFNENFNNVFGKKYVPHAWRSSCYTHVGVELALDFFNMQNPSCVHDLDTYVSLLKSPRRVNEKNWEGGIDVMEMARNSPLLSIKTLETWQWINLVF